MKHRKRYLAALLVFTMFCFPLPAYADNGSGNMNGGGGDMGGGSSQNIWHNGQDGIRVTVVRASDNKPVSTPIDWTNKNENDIRFHFTPKSKLHYRNGASLEARTDKYHYFNPEKPLPTVITGNSTTNITAIKKYFCSEWAAKRIAQVVGCSYDKLTDGTYKLLLEPIGYFTFLGIKRAMTATEAALYDRMAGGALRRKMVSFSHQNLPLSLFLEHADMGYPAYHGSKSSPQSDSTIIAQLGLGIVKYKDDGGQEPDETTATYRVNTDVITSVMLNADSEINPDSPARVSFHILGSTYTRTGVIVPEGDSQLVWVKWHTPSSPQTVTITVDSNKGYVSDDVIVARIENLSGKDPPDPTATDRNDNFKMPDEPEKSTGMSSTWSIWDADWIINWVWDEDWQWEGDRWVDEGDWVEDGGYWDWDSTTYRATLSANMNLLPDDKVPTAQGKKMRSGYGVKINVISDVDSSSSSTHVTGAQTAVTYFPEFAYSKYWRLLDCFQDGLSSSFQFKNNIYSTYNRRVHFTPIWFPDAKYTAYTLVEDAWTPAGMLSAHLTDYVTIDGNVYDDWHIGPQLVD